MSSSDWQSYEAEDGSFELSLPPELTLLPLAGQPPGQIYLYATTADDEATFSVLQGPAGSVTPAAILQTAKDGGAAVTVLADEAIERAGLPARRLRFKLVEQRPRELLEGPHSAALTHTQGGTRTTEAEYVFWSGGEEALRAGYRAEDVDEETRAMLRAMLDSFRPRRPPR